jgi:Uma2 family endonuclease
MTRTATPPPRPKKGEPAWEIAHLFPEQGYWTEGDYLELDTNHLVEFTDGYVEVLPMPTTSHQRIVAHLFMLLSGFAAPRGLGTVLFAPLRVRLRPALIREPDVLFAGNEHAHLIGEKFWTGADLVMEVVSDDAESHERDWVKKRDDYAAAGISEYWVIDPKARRLTVFKLEGAAYVVHAEGTPGGCVESALLPGFSVNADDVFRLLSA